MILTNMQMLSMKLGEGFTRVLPLKLKTYENVERTEKIKRYRRNNKGQFTKKNITLCQN